jgi:hypothetical protein
MIGHIPNGMLQKQFRWEWVNLQLYKRLQERIPMNSLKSIAVELVNKQEEQLSLLRDLVIREGITIPASKIRIQHANALNTVEELYDREYQLLQEYLSVSSYFSPSLGD